MKNLYMIGGTMGIGKTATCHILKRKLDKSVFLDGDWCWDMHPFLVTVETKKMVLRNICYLLNNFLQCSAIENIVFCWVMHEQPIIDAIISGLDISCAKVHLISLICSQTALEARLQKDVDAGIRTKDIIPRSSARLELYSCLKTCKIDVSTLTPEQTADKIILMG